MTAPYTSDSYQGIIDAFNTVRAAQGETKYGYDPNYRGIIDAILDLKNGVKLVTVIILLAGCLNMTKMAT